MSTLSEEESKTLTVQGMRKGVTSVPEPHAKPRKVVKETMESQEEGSGWRRENLTKTAKALKELEEKNRKERKEKEEEKGKDRGIS